MGWAEIAILLIQNAPAAIKTFAEGIEWAKQAWTDVQAAYNKPAAEITREELLAHLDQIKRQSEEIQDIT